MSHWHWRKDPSGSSPSSLENTNQFPQVSVYPLPVKPERWNGSLPGRLYTLLSESRSRGSGGGRGPCRVAARHWGHTAANRTRSTWAGRRSRGIRHRSIRSCKYNRKKTAAVSADTHCVHKPAAKHEQRRRRALASQADRQCIEHLARATRGESEGSRGSRDRGASSSGEGMLAAYRKSTTASDCSSSSQVVLSG